MLQYEGTNYAGWQTQHNAPTVQDELENALAKVLRERVRTAGAGRTDAGVHALGQVAAFKTSKSISPERLLRALNGILAPDIRVTEVADVDADFVPRFAKQKTYRYAIACGQYLSPFQRRYTWRLRQPMSLRASLLGRDV